VTVESTDPTDNPEGKPDSMPGKIKRLINQIIQQKSGGKQVLANVVATKLILKGIDPDKFNDSSPDDPATIAKVAQIAAQMGVAIG